MKRWLIVLGVILAVAAIQVLAISVLYARTLPAAEVMGPALAQSPHIYASLSSSNAAAPLAANLAISDTWVQLGSSTPHDGDLGLEAQSGGIGTCNPNQRIYLGFNVLGFNDTTNIPKLKLYGQSFAGVNAQVTVYGVTDDNWSEALSGISPPALGSALVTETIGTSAMTYTLQSNALTEFVMSNQVISGGNGIASFALQETSCAVTEGTLVIFQDGERSAATVFPGANSGPLDVNLASYEATGGNAKVELQWVTAGESEIEGFAIYRSTSEAEGFARINSSLIAAQGNSSSGANYSFVDDQVENGVTYYYRLEAVSTSGETEVLGVVSATPRRAGKTR